jgi:4'-phosphopantetheinyl transferase
VISRALVAMEFAVATPPQPLAIDEIHLWFFPQWETTSTAAESPAVRGLLAAYLDRRMADVRIEHGAYGKPQIADAALEFNLSHSGGALLLGLSRDRAVGVDLETAQRKTRPVAELARRWFAPAETAALEVLPADRQQAAFLRLWTAKEALVKAQGSGIGAGLHQAVFDPAADGWVCIDPVWRVLPLTPSPAHIGALAWRDPVSRVRAFVAPAIAPQTQSG